MDGKRIVQQIWDIACSQLEDDVLTQDEVIRLLAQLHHSDVLHTSTSPDMEQLSERGQKINRRKLASSFMNPMAIRIPSSFANGSAWRISCWERVQASA